jgi:hypothetical protein
MQKRILFFLAVILAPLLIMAQEAVITGVVKDEKGLPVEAVNIGIKNVPGGVISDQNGGYTLIVTPGTGIHLVFSRIGFKPTEKIITIAEGQTLTIDATIKTTAHEIGPVLIEDVEVRKGTMRRIDPKLATIITTPSGGVEALIKTLPGVTSNNELSSQYSVRGGNFDENLVYVNDIEVYRPFLIRSGQQEGLSFINSDLVSSILFSAGGFEAKYGDKMSSVLDIQYRRPKDFAGTATMSVLGGALHLEGSSKDARFTALTGFRYRTSQYLLSSLDTKGEYKPSFLDLQTFLTYSFTPELEWNFLGNVATNKYEVVPETRETVYGTINDALKLTVFFDGKEKDAFKTLTGASSFIYKPNERTNLKFIASAFHSLESETFDILGQYRLDQLETDFGKEDFGKVAFNRGIGSYLNHSRNYLTSDVYSVEHKGSVLSKNKKFLWGVRYNHEIVEDKLSEWNYIDSAGFSLPYSETNVQLQDVLRTTIGLESNRYSAFIQEIFAFSDSSDFSLTIGSRFNYWEVNRQLLISPRATFSYQPSHWKTDIVFRASAGVYYQPPFYRELRDLHGTLNKDLKAQQSIHYVIGSDYNFKTWNRPFKLVTEIYYKQLSSLVPYEVDNVRIRYYAKNQADGFAKGIDLKINGEFVKGIESWASLSVMRTYEDLKDDFYYDYYNKSNEKIIPGFTFDQTRTDSIRREPGNIPRPTDQLVTFAIFFQDYLPKWPRFRMNLNMVVGTGMPYGPPDFNRYKDVLRMPPYRRVDIGFSYVLKPEDKELSPKNPFHVFKSAWISAEVLNLLQVQNTISYTWIMDVTGRRYAIPNYLTDRLVNLKLVAKF